MTWAFCAVCFLEEPSKREDAVICGSARENRRIGAFHNAVCADGGSDAREDCLQKHFLNSFEEINGGRPVSLPW
jgi:hypothetical protein